MHVHWGAKMIYLAHPKTASVATGKALENSGFVSVGKHHALLKEAPIIDRSQWLVFTTIRNHWDAAVSWMFISTSSRKVPQEKKVAEILDPSRNKYVSTDRMWWMHADCADVVLRFETIEEDLQQVLLSRGIELHGLPKKNVTQERRGRHYRDFLNRSAENCIRDRFREEISHFGYEF